MFPFVRKKPKRPKAPLHNFFMILALIFLIYVFYQNRQNIVHLPKHEQETSTDAGTVEDNKN